MAENINRRNNLHDFKNFVEYNELTGSQTINYTTFVYHITRYLSDPLHTSQTGIVSSDVNDVYQLTITDGKCKRKALLDSNLSRLVQSGELKEGSGIRLEKCSVKCDETDLQQRTYLIIHELTVLDIPDLNLTISECADIQWCNDCDECEMSPAPLSSSRGYCLNTWSSVEMDGDVWKKGNPELMNMEGMTPVDLYTIKEISSNWRYLKCPPILVRVLSKRRILHYAKPSKNDKWPLQVHLTVCDRTGCATLVLWNALCPDYYHRIQEGHVLLIQRFTVKKSFHQSDSYIPLLPDGLHMFDIDINVNSHHPVGQIKVISPPAVPSGLNLPQLQYTFIHRRELGLLPCDYVCDIVGVVTYCGRFFREKMTGKRENDLGGFWISRWLELRDHTSDKTFKVHVYRPAEIDIYDKIHPGSVVVCRHMRVIHSVGHITSSRDSRLVYLTSTGSTRLFLATQDVSSQHVSDVITFASTGSLKYTMIGYFSYPPLPQSLAGLKSYYEDLQLTTSDGFLQELDHLSYREHKRLFLQCKMVYIKYSQAQVRMSRRKDDKKLYEMVIDEDLYSYYRDQISETVVHPPYIYKYDQERLNDLLGFPSFFTKKIPVSDLELTERCNGCFIIYWSGLNNKVLIPTIWTFNKEVKPEDKLEHLLCCSVKSLEQNSNIDQREITQIISSAKDCFGHRYLAVLDMYKPEWNEIEIILNSAYCV